MIGARFEPATMLGRMHFWSWEVVQCKAFADFQLMLSPEQRIRYAVASGQWQAVQDEARMVGVIA